MRLSKFSLLYFSTLIITLFYILQISSRVQLQPQYQYEIGIVIVFERNTKRDNYRIALDSVECYAKIQNYKFLFLNETDFDDRCKQPDYFFRRHCIIAQVLPKFDAILFLDADIGIVNPNRRIEEFMDDSKDLIFYDRFYNWEVAIGSYIIRNTKFARDGLLKFANYNDRLPKSHHGSDNGILHLFLVEFLFPESQLQIETCQKIYNKSRDYDDLFTFQACTRAIMGTSTEFDKVRIIRKGKGWVRDGGLSNSKWNSEIDFMFHDWKMDKLGDTPENVAIIENRGEWFNPFAGEIDLKKCGPNNSTWNYDSRLIGDSQKILEYLRGMEKRINLDFVKSISRIMEVINRK